MDHADHVRLIAEAITGQVWADLGSGTGAFTLALRDILGPNGTIYSVDRNAQNLAEQSRAMASRYPGSVINYIVADFTQPLDLPTVDGIVLANSLHFVDFQQQLPAMRHLASYIKPGGGLVLVEYNSDHGNQWVPFPISFNRFTSLTNELGFGSPKFLDNEASGFMREIYSAGIRIP